PPHNDGSGRWSPAPIDGRRSAVSCALPQSNIVRRGQESPVARKLLVCAVLAALVLTGAPQPAAAAAPALQEVMFVGNNWAGTVDVIRPRGSYARLGGFSVVPDLDARLLEIYLNPVRL